MVVHPQHEARDIKVLVRLAHRLVRISWEYVEHLCCTPRPAQYAATYCKHAKSSLCFFLHENSSLFILPFEEQVGFQLERGRDRCRVLLSGGP